LEKLTGGDLEGLKTAWSKNWSGRRPRRQEQTSGGPSGGIGSKSMWRLRQQQEQMALALPCWQQERAVSTVAARAGRAVSIVAARAGVVDWWSPARIS